jgi:alpha-glucosidase
MRGEPKNPPEHEVNLVFTRMLSGPMDYTPGILS